jgi:tRNA 2-thiocytidine biosynthesis protein TtcA
METTATTQAIASTPSAADKKAAFEINKLSKRLHRQVGQAIADFNMIEDGDKVMVCLSGGKDSYALLDILLNLQQRAPIRFEIVAVNLDQKQPGFPADVLPNYLRSRGVNFHIETQDTYSIVKKLVPEGQTMCSLCSRLRRGILYRVAKELGATKIALGHHRDDMVVTLLMNMFFGSRIKGVPPKPSATTNRRDPAAGLWPADLAAERRQFPIIVQPVRQLENLQRADQKMIREWDRPTQPDRQHVQRDGQHHAVAHDGPLALPVPDHPRDGPARPGRRQGLRRGRRGLRHARRWRQLG